MAGFGLLDRTEIAINVGLRSKPTLVHTAPRPFDAGKGRPASIDAARVREMKAEGMGTTELAKALGIGPGECLSGIGISVRQLTLNGHFLA